MVDVIIRGGHVIDGTGATRVQTDVGITAGKISALGELKGHSCALEINAGGKIVCPGFIDSHAHSEISVLAHAQKWDFSSAAVRDVPASCARSHS